MHNNLVIEQLDRVTSWGTAVQVPLEVDAMMRAPFTCQLFSQRKVTIIPILVLSLNGKYNDSTGHTAMYSKLITHEQVIMNKQGPFG